MSDYSFPSWITDPVSVPGQLSLLDPIPTPSPIPPAPDPDPTPPHGLARLDWAIEVQVHTTEELVAWGSSMLVESDDDSDLVDAIRLELERRGVRLFGRWNR